MAVTRNGAHGPPTSPNVLISKSKSVSPEELNNQSNLYNNTYQFFSIFIIQITNILSCSTHTGIFSKQYEDDPDTSFTTSKEISIGTALVLSLLVAGAVSTRKDISINDANEIRQQVNPWYRRFKTASGLGNNFGQLAGEFIALIPLIPLWLKKPISLVFGSIVGLVFGGISLLFNSNPNEYNIKLCQSKPDQPDSDTMYIYLKGNEPYYYMKNKKGSLYTAKIEPDNLEDQNEKQKSANEEAFKQFKQTIINAILNGKNQLPYKDQSQLYDLVEKNNQKSFYKKSIFYLGRDGWSKYAKAGLQLGAPIGAAIGALIGFLVPIPGGMALGIAVGGALGGILGFATFATLVPLYNKYKQSRAKTSNHLTPLTNDNELDKKLLNTPQKDKIPYRTNYIRIGTTVGSFLGTIIGFIIGMICIPIPGGALLGATLGAGIGALTCSAVSAFLGPHISNFLKDNNYSSWDYGARTGAYLGGTTVGGIVTGTLMMVGINVKVLKNVIYAGFGLIGSAIGGIYDAICTNKNKKDDDWKENKFKNDNAPVLPWSQRLPTFATAGVFLGGILGCILFAAVPPLAIIGIGVGIAIGAGIGASAFTLIGAAWGNKIYKKLHIYIEKNKIGTHKDTSEPAVPDSTKTITSALDSNESSNIESVRHPERSEASPEAPGEILRYAQDDVGCAKDDLASQSFFASNNTTQTIEPEKFEAEGFLKTAAFCNLI